MPRIIIIPEGTVPVRILAGKEWRGVKHYSPAIYNVSTEFAKHTVDVLSVGEYVKVDRNGDYDDPVQEESGAVPTSALPCLTATTAEFSSIIREWLTADHLAKIRAGNADVDDFCDANMAMLGAVEKMAPGFELDSSSTEQSDFFEKVWTGAKQARYCNHIQEQLIDEHHAYNATTIEATNRLHSTSSSSEKNCRPGSFITEPCFPLLQQNILGSPNVRDS